MTDFDPASTLLAVDEGADRLEKAAEAVHDAILRYERAEAMHDREMEKQLLVIYHRAKEAGERPPAEDIRRALAHEAMDNGVYGEFLEAKAQRDALLTRYQALGKSVSARQSILKAVNP